MKIDFSKYQKLYIRLTDDEEDDEYVYPCEFENVTMKGNTITFVQKRSRWITSTMVLTLPKGCRFFTLKRTENGVQKDECDTLHIVGPECRFWPEKRTIVIEMVEL
jgi:hypothetical protein